MSKNLLYRPDLSYDKSYYTEGYISNNKKEENKNQSYESENKVDKIEQIKNLANDIKTKIPFLPNDIVDTFLPPFIIVDNVIEDLINNEINIPLEHIIDEPNNDLGENEEEKKDDTIITDDIPDNPFGTEEENFVDIPIIIIPKDKEIDDQYVIDILDIFEKYLMEYNFTLDKYINNSILIFSKVNYDDLKHITTATLKDKNLSHVSDYITKSSITLQQKMMLYKKQFNMDETIHRIKAVKVAKELKKRYFTNQRLEGKNILEVNANKLLNESKLVYKKKYEENFYSLYKYLNSSVIIFNECVNLSIKQKESLVLLNNFEREK